MRLKETPDPKDFDAALKVFCDENLQRREGLYELDETDLENSSKGVNFSGKNSLYINDQDIEHEAICLERKPQKALLAIKPNTYIVSRQINAIDTIINHPTDALRPLLRLFEPFQFSENEWEEPEITEEPEWKLLADSSRDGYDMQRQFVRQALGTHDFAIMNGPPGSGKTTVICELIRLLTQQDKRILLCASTHVAVDNVLERLMDSQNEWRHGIIPIRIGDENNVSDLAKPYRLGTFMETERRRLETGLKNFQSVVLPRRKC